MPVKKNPEEAAETRAAASRKKPASSSAKPSVVVVVNNGTAKPRRKKTQSPMTKVKRKIAKVTGIPTTAAGRKKKLESSVAGFLLKQLDKLDK